MAEKNLSDMFNDPANKKFRKAWTKEQDILDDFELGMNWFQQWSDKRDHYAAANDQQRAASCEGLVQFWDDWLVKSAGRLAKHKMHVDAGKDDVMKEFGDRKLTILQPLYDALGMLDDTQIKSGKAIFEALKPLAAAQKPAAPAPQKPGPLDGGNPFKKGPK